MTTGDRIMNATEKYVQDREIVIRYRNWKGIVALRRIVPLYLRFGTSEWHGMPQWILEAHDLDKDEPRSFAWKDIEIVHVEKLSNSYNNAVNETLKTGPAMYPTKDWPTEPTIHPDDSQEPITREWLKEMGFAETPHRWSDFPPNMANGTWTLTEYDPGNWIISGDVGPVFKTRQQIRHLINAGKGE